MNTIAVRQGDLGFVLTFNIQEDATTKDLTSYDTNTLMVKGQVARTLTVASASLGRLTWTTVAGDWTGSNFTTAGKYLAQISLNNSGGTARIDTDPFCIQIKGPFEE